MLADVAFLLLSLLDAFDAVRMLPLIFAFDDTLA